MMESTPEGEKKKPPEGSSGGGENKTKRKMKTAAQLELLEKTYALEAYPSESVRQELSVKLGLTDRQLQMWFCHRRLKDRKVTPTTTTTTKRARKEVPLVAAPSGQGSDEMMVGERGNEPGSGSGSGSSPFEQRRVVGRQTAGAVSRAGPDVPMVKRYYEPPQLSLESRAIAFVEAQLGEPLRENGPDLGMEFDPLPPGAFGAPTAITGMQKQAGRPQDGKMYERPGPKSSKMTSVLPSLEHSFLPISSNGKRKLTAGDIHVGHPQVSSRAKHEYQFLPEKPSVRSCTYERLDPSHFYSSPLDGPTARGSSLSAGGSYPHGKEQVPTGYVFQGQGSSSLSSHQGRQGHVIKAAAGDYDGVSHRNFTDNEMDVQVGSHPLIGLENPLESLEMRISHEEDALRLERKRKSDEARIAREVEAHEKRIRKELEKQDIMRRKREEQMRREMERHDRERRKEEERLMREKQREEERFQREQRRELERRERFLQKENLRAEKMRQKEELRREKEAARAKAANERATARRIAKESMELIEDERLELMELAASSKGLPSIIALDSETLENLDLFRDMLCEFPPGSVQLRRPFVIQPWTDSENTGNLFMVWRFLITFTDVLDLWPFTLDEFVQAFHDYDPRLLGEIHVALLRLIIKDIEDVARTPSFGLGANQIGSANPGGGHPQIVEGAYAWGFDIRSWQRHLNPLTWPEILRQFALSAGFGPQLKKRTIEQGFFRDDNEGHDCEDIVSTLRNGAAAVSAAAVMQEKGLSNPRRSRHRLTPGTVKFAAFHVLSLEGSKGLTILEVADRIQKSGLRDLTTSKTPEASIAAALSRDSNLFERTAPSTYCVRAAYRKDPNDAEAILSTARVKIQIFENGFSDSEEAEKAEDAEDVERDDSECDVEDPEVDDIGVAVNQTIEGHQSADIKTSKRACSENGKRENISNEVDQILRSGPENAGNSSPSFLSKVKKEINSLGDTNDHHSVDVASNSYEPTDTDLEDAEIDESNSGAPWVQGLMEGEYSDLTVEERLNALVALIGVAIEGNSIRVVLEERLEAANALKKQMWAEAQLDKRRMKEEYTSKPQNPSFVGIKNELNVMSSALEGSQSPFGDNRHSEPSLNGKQEPLLDPNSAQNDPNSMSTERNLLGEEFSAGPDISQQQHAYAAAEKSRSQFKSYIGQKAEEMYVYRSLPLGQDRRRNRYWLFVASASTNDPGTGRIFFESQDGCWRLIDSEEAFDALLVSLDTRGTRESHLYSMLQKVEVLFKEAVRKNLRYKNHVDSTEATVKTEASEMAYSPDHSAGIESPSSTVCGLNSDTMSQSSSFRIELGKTEAERTSALKRYEDFQKWMWKECVNPSVLCAIKFGKRRCSELLITCDYCHDTYSPKENLCPVCGSEHVAQFEWKRDPDSSLPLRVRLLKAQVALTEVSVPPEALESLWTEDNRNSWGFKLQSALSAEDLLQILTLFEGAIKRDCLSSNFETTKELLGSFTASGCSVDNSSTGLVPILPWIPRTTAAIALRLLELDSSIAYMPQQNLEFQKDKEAGEFIKLPSKYAMVKNIQEIEPTNTPLQADYLQEENWFEMKSGRSSSGRGRGGRGRGRGRNRTRGGRWAKGSSGLGIESGMGSSVKGEKMGQGLGKKSRTRGGGRGHNRGRRSVRSRQRSASVQRVVDRGIGGFGQFGNTIVIPKQNNFPESPQSSGGEERGWEEEETRRMHIDEGNDNSNSIEGASEESDDDGQATRYQYDVRRTDYGGMYSGKSEDLMEEDEEDGEGDMDGDDYEEERYVDGEDVDMEEGYPNLERNQNVDLDYSQEEDDDEEEEENVDDVDEEKVYVGGGEETASSSDFSD